MFCVDPDLVFEVIMPHPIEGLRHVQESHRTVFPFVHSSFSGTNSTMHLLSCSVTTLESKLMIWIQDSGQNLYLAQRQINQHATFDAFQSFSYLWLDKLPCDS